MRRWGKMGALALVVLVGMATPAVAHDIFTGDAHQHILTPAPRDTFCATLLSGAESGSAPANNPTGVHFPDSSGAKPGDDNGDPNGSYSQPSPLGYPAAGNAVDHHWVHDDPRVSDPTHAFFNPADVRDPLVFDFGVAVSTIHYYPVVDHPAFPTVDPFSGLVYGSNDADPDVVGDTLLDLVLVWDQGWDTTNTSYIDDFVQEYVSPAGAQPSFRYIKVLTDYTAWKDTELDAVCAPGSPPGGTAPGSGKIAHTQTTCQNYLANPDGSIPESPGNFNLDLVSYGVKSGKISNTAPGVFFYYSTVVADPDGNFTIDVVQTDNGPTPAFQPQNLANIRLFDASCTAVGIFTADTSVPGVVTYNVTGATPGATYIVSVKYVTSSVVGAADPGADVIYTFGTRVNAGPVGQTDTVTLRKKA